MSTTIKKQLMDLIVTELGKITGINGRVFYSPSRGIKEEEHGDYICVFDDLHGKESCAKLDLYAEKSFNCSIHLWVQRTNDTTLNDALNDYDGLIETALLPLSSAFRTARLCHKFECTSTDKLMYDDNGLGVLVKEFDVVYRHLYGNPFQLNP